MEDECRWRVRAAEMREKAAHSKEPFVADGFRALAMQYDRMAEEGARWLPPQVGHSTGLDQPGHGQTAQQAGHGPSSPRQGSPAEHASESPL